MKISATPFALLLIFTFSLLQKSASAAEKSYVVLLGAHPHDVEPNLVDVQNVKRSHHNLLKLFVGSEIDAKRKFHYSYAMHIDAFGVILDEDLARNISRHPDVVSVLESKASYVQTSHSWEFLGMEKDGEIPPNSIRDKASLGKDVIIGNLDHGVYPSSKSFSDEGIGPIPSKWRGICQLGVGCNKKLIGARYFNKEFSTDCVNVVKLNLTMDPPGAPETCHDDTPLDNNGHGTHTLSIAGGSSVSDPVSVFGQGTGIVKGGAPMARVAAYRVCYEAIFAMINNEETMIGPCSDLDMLAGFDAAIYDGVDVINLSLVGGDNEFYRDVKAIAAFHAVKRGIVVVACAGNDGPDPGSVLNVAPWMITVGSSTTDRDFVNYVVLGDGKFTRLTGTNLCDKKLEDKMYPIVTGLDSKASNSSIEDAIHCKTGSIDLSKIRDKILICRVNMTNNIASRISATVVNGGGIGFVSVNDDPIRKITNSCPITFVPSSHLGFDEGNVLFDYINSTPNPMAYITPITTEFGTKPVPVVALTSSRGPNSMNPSILKPDVTAPGVNILAAYPDNIAPGGAHVVEDESRVAYNIMSGTSMAAPHVAGIVALLKSIHPDWTPAAIQSAIMTTASTEPNGEAMLDSTMLKATPFGYGAGQIQPNLAMDPGLVYDLTNEDYLNFLCAHGYNSSVLRIFSHVPYDCPKEFLVTDFNYPSITVPNLGGGPVTVMRRLKNVGSAGTYQAQVKAPPEFTVEVSPPSLTFEKIGEEKVFTLVIKPATKSNGYVFGELVWSDGMHFVKSPLVIQANP